MKKIGAMGEQTDGPAVYYLASDVDARIAELEEENFELYAKAVSMFHLVPDDVIASDIQEKYKQFKGQQARIAELQKALRNIADPLAFHTIQEMREIAKSVL